MAAARRFEAAVGLGFIGGMLRDDNLQTIYVADRTNRRTQLKQIVAEESVCREECGCEIPLGNLNPPGIQGCHNVHVGNANLHPDVTLLGDHLAWTSFVEELGCAIVATWYDGSQNATSTAAGLNKGIQALVNR